MPLPQRHMPLLQNLMRNVWIAVLFGLHEEKRLTVIANSSKLQMPAARKGCLLAALRSLLGQGISEHCSQSSALPHPADIRGCLLQEYDAQACSGRARLRCPQVEERKAYVMAVELGERPARANRHRTRPVAAHEYTTWNVTPKYHVGCALDATRMCHQYPPRLHGLMDTDAPILLLQRVAGALPGRELAHHPDGSSQRPGGTSSRAPGSTPGRIAASSCRQGQAGAA